MNKFEHQRRTEFLSDLRDLADQYGWTLDEAIDIIGFKQKSNNDLLLEQAKEKYTVGVVFYPLNRDRKQMILDEGEPYWFADGIWINTQSDTACCVFTDNKWAKIIK